LDSREARIILACYRPGVDDSASEPFAGALAQARKDPELARWLEQESAFDAAIGDRLRDAPVPPDLHARILAGRPASRPVASQGAPAPGEPAPAAAVPAAWWRRPLVAVPSLALVLIAAIVGVEIERRASPGDFKSWREEMGALVAGDYKLDLESRNLADLQSFFAGRQWPADYSVPTRLQAYPLEGGMAVEWHGHRISVICFGVENDDDKDLWLFIAGPDALSGAPSSPAPEFAPAGKLTTAAWSSNGKIYLLAGRGGEQSLREFLPERAAVVPTTPPSRSSPS
jgi:hypothetical protein